MSLHRCRDLLPTFRQGWKRGKKRFVKIKMGMPHAPPHQNGAHDYVTGWFTWAHIFSLLFASIFIKEHHIQAALNTQQMSGTLEVPVVIPVPEANLVVPETDVRMRNDCMCVLQFAIFWFSFYFLLSSIFFYILFDLLRLLFHPQYSCHNPLQSLSLSFLLSFFLSVNISIYLSIHLSIPLSFFLFFTLTTFSNVYQTPKKTACG